MLSGQKAFLTGLCAIGHLAASEALGCIQSNEPIDVTIVHHELRLIDIRLSPDIPDNQIKRSNGLSDPVWRTDHDGTRSTRLRLRPDELLGLVSESETRTAPIEWFDPMPLASDQTPEAEQTPAWALGAVWYNIFPERFDDANPTNNQGWPHGTPMAWDAAWSEVTADEFEASANRAIAWPRRYGDDHDRSRAPLRETVFERRFGGDLEGALRRLDHISSLGATAIWFCPVFDSTSLHKYDAADHRHIDPTLAGPSVDAEVSRAKFSVDPATWEWTVADRFFVDELLPGAKQRGLRVIIDGVWNHVGLAHPAFIDAAKRGPASPYFDWFEMTADASGQAVSWQAWDRQNGSLPVFRQHNDTLADGPREHVEHVTRRWMDPDGDGDPSDGIDGWRLDVANEVPLGFWSPWRDLVRTINPNATLIGELWFDGRDYFGGRAFDSQMNYPLAFALTGWLGRTPSMTTEALVLQLDRLYAHHPATSLAQVNLLSSHDTPRVASMLANPGREYDRGAELDADGFDRTRPSDEVFDMVELGFAVLTMLPGSPMVYNGDELGMWGADDPENRMPMTWPDLAPWSGSEQAEHAQRMTARIASWLTLRQHPTIGPVLRYGMGTWSSDGELLIVDRQLDAERVRLVVNRSKNPLIWEDRRIRPRSAELFTASADGSQNWDHMPRDLE